MRKFIAMLCTITLVAGSVAVYGASGTPGDENGDIVSNPWEELFTTTDETTQADLPTDIFVTTTAASVTTAAPIETTTVASAETTTAAPVETTVAAPTDGQEQTTVVPTEGPTTKVSKPAKAKIKKVNAKKKSAKKVKISLRKTKGAVGYQIAIYKVKKNAKKNKKAIVKRIVKKRKVTIKSKKLKNKKKLFVRARAFVLDAKGNKVYGKWSKIKKVKIKR